MPDISPAAGLTLLLAAGAAVAAGIKTYRTIKESLVGHLEAQLAIERTGREALAKEVAEHKAQVAKDFAELKAAVAKESADRSSADALMLEKHSQVNAALAGLSQQNKDQERRLEGMAEKKADAHRVDGLATWWQTMFEKRGDELLTRGHDLGLRAAASLKEKA